MEVKSKVERCCKNFGCRLHTDECAEKYEKCPIWIAYKNSEEQNLMLKEILTKLKRAI